MKNSHAFGGSCCFNNERLDTNSKLILTTNKMAVEISQDDTEETISNHIKSGIFNFGLDLFFGSVEQNFEVIKRLQDAVCSESKMLGFSIPISVYLKLSPRLQYTGRFKRNKTAVNLKLQRKVVLTTNRKYASRSCHSFIYVNAKYIIADVKKCDIICLGKCIQLQVVETNSDHVVCKVIAPGLVTPRMPVRFPKHIQIINSKVSAEELEDVTFAIRTYINVIVTYTPENPEYHSALRETLAEFKCNNFNIFTRITLTYLENLEDTTWIADAYDGFLLDCLDKVPEDKIVKLSLGVQEFMEKSFIKTKPIFLQGCWSKFIDPSDYHYAFYYPDKNILPCKSNFLRLFEAVFIRLSKIQFSEKNVTKKIMCADSALARSIAGASFDLETDAIVVCSTFGKMATRISHFKPKTVIVAITSLMSVVNYLSMHHNIWALSYDTKNEGELLQNEETHQKLVYGLRYACLKKLVDDSSTVILVYRQQMEYGSTDKFAVVKFDKNFENTIRNVVMN